MADYSRQRGVEVAEEWRVLFRSLVDQHESFKSTGESAGLWDRKNRSEKLAKLIALGESLAVYVADAGLDAEPFWNVYRTGKLSKPSFELSPADDFSACCDAAVSIIEGQTSTLPNERRDAWMTNQKSLGKTHKEIRADLKSNHSEWDYVFTNQAVGQAIKRHKERN